MDGLVSGPLRNLVLMHDREYKAYVPMTGWSYGFYNANGSINDDAVRVNSRTYAQAIAGVTQSMHFDENTYVFKLSYRIRKSCTLPTEIYLHEKMFYPRGMT